METLKRTRQRWLVWSDRFFPLCEIEARKIPPLVQLALFSGMALAFSAAGLVVPADGVVGFDWVNVFSRGSVPPFYPPWGSVVIRLLSWPSLTGLSLAAIALAALRRAAHPLSLLFTLLCLPVFWTLFLGQLEGLVTLGLLGLPWLAPLALLKPQISVFAFGARREYLAAGLIVLVISLIVWGPWPLQMFATNQYYAEGRYEQDISFGLWGLVVAIPMLWFSRGDMDMLMLAGAFATPHLIPYNLLPATTAVARLRPGAGALACVVSWLPFSANWLGPGGWWLGWLFVAFVWLVLAAKRYPETAIGRLFRRFV